MKQQNKKRPPLSQWLLAVLTLAALLLTLPLMGCNDDDDGLPADTISLKLRIFDANKSELPLLADVRNNDYVAQINTSLEDRTVVVHATPVEKAQVTATLDGAELAPLDPLNPLEPPADDFTVGYTFEAYAGTVLQLTVTAEGKKTNVYTITFEAPPESEAPQDKDENGSSSELPEEPESEAQEPALSGDWTLSTFSVQLADGAVHDLRDPNSRSLSLVGAQTVVFQAVPSHPKAQVTGDVGERQVNEGVNQFNIVSTAENGEKQNFSVQITVTKPAETPPPPSKSSNAALASLTVTLPDGSLMNLNPGFVPETTTYVAEAPGDTAYVVLAGTPQDPAATLAGAGQYTLNAGKNDLTLTVTAEDGTTVNSYTVSIYAGAALVPDLDPGLDPDLAPDLAPAQ